MLEAISKSIEIKAEVVSRDETEQGVRKWLNLGHTFGHAIEVYGRYKEFSHGEAVALGIIMATNLSEKVLGLEKVESDRIKGLISNVLSDEHKNKEFQPDHLLELMSSDKKRKGNQLNFVLQIIIHYEILVLAGLSLYQFLMEMVSILFGSLNEVYQKTLQPQLFYL